MVLGVLGGVVWRLIATPGTVTITPEGPVTTEPETLRYFANVLLFLGIGAAICLPWGFALAIARGDDGWRLVPVAVIVPILAAVAARSAGLALVPDKVRIPKGVKTGDSFPGNLSMDAWSAVVAWAAFGVAGVLLATWLWSPTHVEGEPADTD
jgi:hypothetical protein